MLSEARSRSTLLASPRSDCLQRTLDAKSTLKLPSLIETIIEEPARANPAFPGCESEVSDLDGILATC